MRDVILPSGAKLHVAEAPFTISKALYQALLRELKYVQITSDTEFNSLYKDLFANMGSSQEVENCIWECLKRCLYNDEKVTPDTFEPSERRQDYLTVCAEVIKENVGPFLKNLFAHYKEFMAMKESILK